MLEGNGEPTRMFSPGDEDSEAEGADQVLSLVYSELWERGYDPVEQLVGYLLSGDPTYITESGGARKAVSRMERDELLLELVAFYLSRKG